VQNVGVVVVVVVAAAVVVVVFVVAWCWQVIRNSGVLMPVFSLLGSLALQTDELTALLE